jgi:signal transduction histidine kinase
MPRVLTRYGGAVVAVGLATFGTIAARQIIGPMGALFFFPAVVISAMYWGYGPGMLATLLSVLSLAFFYFPPEFGFGVGADDALRLIVFATMSIITAWLSSAKDRAEDALRHSLTTEQSVNATFRRLSEWPVTFGIDVCDMAKNMLEYASTIVGAQETIAIWEPHDEPWTFAADPARPDVVSKHNAADARDIAASLLNGRTEQGWRAAAFPFKTEHLTGRVFFIGMNDQSDKIVPTAELVAREIGMSLDQHHVAEQMRSLAVREERIRLARDLHDGVLQALTGVRLQLQQIADQHDASQISGQLLDIERAIGSEQRELRLFIDDVKPDVGKGAAGELAQALTQLVQRLGCEWKTPISARVTPSGVSVSADLLRALRLMVHEAVINALKHAHPSRVSVDVQVDSEHGVTIVVANDGRGFPFTGRLDHHVLMQSHAGPRTLCERVVGLGGTLSVESSASGSSVEMKLPLSDYAAARRV